MTIEARTSLAQELELITLYIYIYKKRFHEENFTISGLSLKCSMQGNN